MYLKFLKLLSFIFIQPNFTNLRFDTANDDRYKSDRDGLKTRGKVKTHLLYVSFGIEPNRENAQGKAGHKI